MSEYKDLEILSKKLGTINSINYLLYWDNLTYMPKNSSENRSEQMKLLDDIYIHLLVNENTADLLSHLNNKIDTFDSFQQKNIRYLQDEYNLSLKIPLDLQLNILPKL